MCNRNVGFFRATRCGSVILGSVFSTMFLGKHLQILISEGVEAYYVFQSSRFFLTQYVFQIFKVSVTQSATWVIFTELIWTSLTQILIYLPRLLWFLEGWFQKTTDQLDGTVQCFCGRSIFLCQNSKRRGAMIWLPKYYASSVGVPCCHCRMD